MTPKCPIVPIMVLYSYYLHVLNSPPYRTYITTTSKGPLACLLDTADKYELLDYVCKAIECADYRVLGHGRN